MGKIMDEAKIKDNLIGQGKYLLLVNQFLWNPLAGKAVYIEILLIMRHMYYFKLWICRIFEDLFLS